MHFPKFWQKAVEGRLIAWGWSDANPDDALANARSRVQRIRDWLSRGESRPSVDTQYGYPNRPMREEVLREFRDGDGALVGIVSRNRPGCEVLNTTNLLFIDIDEPYAKPQGVFSKWFGGKKSSSSTGTFEETIQNSVRAWLDANPGWGLRVYRTRAGARIIATHVPVPQDDAMVNAIFSTFNADMLYRELCATQKCFRARLTPKAWRCKIPDPGVCWPWENDGVEQKFRTWQQRYAAVAANFATCRLLGQFGNETLHPALAELIHFHDSATRADTSLPLA